MMIYREYRRIIFWIFVGLFFVTASSVLLYAFGYRYSFERGIFVYSGSVTLQTIPDTVTIKIDSEIVPKKRIGILNNTIHITGLMPGEHFLEVSAPGYQTWSKRAIVRSGISTEFWNIILLRESFELETLPDTNNINQVFPDPSGNRLALLIQNEDEISVVFLDRARGTRQQVYASTKLHFGENSFEKIEWSPARNRLVLPLFDEEGSFQPVITDLRNGETILLSDLIEGEIQNTRFDNRESGIVYFIANQKLYRLIIDDNRRLELLAEEVDAYDLSRDFIYIARLNNGGIYRFRANANGETLTQVSIPPSISEYQKPISLIVYDDERFVILERSGKQRLFIYNIGLQQDYGYQELGSAIEGVQFSNDGKKLLFFNKNEMSVYFTRPWEVQPVREENSIVQIARFSDPIGGVQWTEDYEHILFYQGSTIKLIELDGRDHRVISDLISLPAVPTQMFLLANENRLFFVIPGVSVSSIIFPEPQGLFGQ